MRSKWSKVIKPSEEEIVIESFQMLDLPQQAVLDQDRETMTTDGQEGDSDPVHDCSLLQQQAYEAGRKEGLDEGREQLQAEAQAETERALNLVAQSRVVKTRAIQQAEGDIVVLALAIAKKVIHREAAIDKEIVACQVRKALGILAEQAFVRIKAHPDDVAHLEQYQSTFVNRDGQSVPIRLEPDPSTRPGGCIVESDSLVIDADIDRQLEVIGEILIKDVEEHEAEESHATS